MLNEIDTYLQQSHVFVWH